MRSVASASFKNNADSLLFEVCLEVLVYLLAISSESLVNFAIGVRIILLYKDLD